MIGSLWGRGLWDWSKIKGHMHKSRLCRAPSSDAMRNKSSKSKQVSSSHIGVNGKQTDENEKDIRMHDDMFNDVEYAERLKLLGISFINDRFYKMFDGKNMEVKEILEQFNEVREKVDHETLISKINASTKGNAHKWICGLDEEVINSWERFKEEIIQFFDHQWKTLP
ncbi:hypothetical protein M153_3680002663 [Pseudoloma neurophilia]|uniref:Uncharacterized protein n=1 Tax=Pseudoloma neurophilia TaxID=146866 RepID=A0A0R0LXW2_9MICR|nr:hypothetical protein M153_3680002663 [Pseudoloma neurophilia]